MQQASNARHPDFVGRTIERLLCQGPLCNPAGVPSLVVLGLDSSRCRPHVQARKLEGELDIKLAAFAKLGGGVRGPHYVRRRSKLAIERIT